MKAAESLEAQMRAQMESAMRQRAAEVLQSIDYAAIVGDSGMGTAPAPEGQVQAQQQPAAAGDAAAAERRGGD